uniref:Uncharacterized protein n=1 Tax=Anguilla anguilla TaxID=7936 RepID=A0A0E9X263_ANGAN
MIIQIFAHFLQISNGICRTSYKHKKKIIILGTLPRGRYLANRSVTGAGILPLYTSTDQKEMPSFTLLIICIMRK